MEIAQRSRKVLSLWKTDQEASVSSHKAWAEAIKAGRFSLAKSHVPKTIITSQRTFFTL